MSKRDDDSQADMEVGMTTAERRRRRRRGGGLRVPSDNVPRRTTPPVVAPVPEDPSLAMSIAYSFTNDASEPIPRVTVETPVPKFDPIAPEAMPTVIDPPAMAVESSDFEMKTREMSAVDLEALGLSETSGAMPRTPNIDFTTSDQLPGVGVEVRFKSPPKRDLPTQQQKPLEVDVDVNFIDGTSPNDEPTTIGGPPDREVKPVEIRPRKERVKTVALTEDDLEEVREAVRAATSPSPPPTMSEQSQTQPQQPQPSRTTTTPSAPPPFKTDTSRPSTSMPPPAKTETRPSGAIPPIPVPKVETSRPSIPVAAARPIVESANRTQPLSPMDIEVDAGSARSDEEPMSVPEIDIQELSDRASESSGEFEVDVDEVSDVKTDTLPAQPSAADEMWSQTPSPPPAPSEKRSRPASVPPPIAPQAASTSPGVGVPGPPPAPHHAHPPPPPPAAHHHKPPAPPPAKSKVPPAAVAATATKEGKGEKRGKPWFVDLFDEDYLRTLPFLTPQATQAEAEFVIDAMGLSTGAQVLDVGCGYGRHAMELAARGYHVVGLDMSTPLLVRGGEEAHRRGLTINFVRGDMRELDFENQFDGAYCLFSTFGYFDDETNKKTIANIARALKPGGRVLLEILNRDYVISDLPTRVWWEGEGCVVLEEVELNYFSSRIQVNRSVVFDDGRQLEQEISVRAYSLHEVGKLMHAAGFRVLEVSGGYQTRGRFFGNQSRHIIVLAERKDTATP